MGRRTTGAAGPAARLLGVLVLLAATAACTTAEPPSPGAVEPDLGTPLSQVHTRRLVVPREPFCDRLPAVVVERALGGPARNRAAYNSGDRVRLTPAVRDVAHEHGCVFRGRKKAVARAWVFAPPVTRARARALVAAAATAVGCSPVADAPAFGRPSAATVCEAGGVRLTTYAGLFGDAWLSCSLSTTTLGPGALLDQAGRWCAAVALAAAG
jgi:hypothetical protein